MEIEEADPDIWNVLTMIQSQMQNLTEKFENMEMRSRMNQRIDGDVASEANVQQEEQNVEHSCENRRENGEIIVQTTGKFVERPYFKGKESEAMTRLIEYKATSKQNSWKERMMLNSLRKYLMNGAKDWYIVE